MTEFVKCQATGNDFVVFNGFGNAVNFTFDELRTIADRRFGVGADGIIILRPDSQADFFMEFYNSDASVASFCGNGGRCAVLVAYHLGLVREQITFRALDGTHKAIVEGQTIRLSLNTSGKGLETKYGLFINTGVPHVVQLVENLSAIDVENLGRKIRYAPEFQPEGTNVNFVQKINDNTLLVRTYERGVEAPTLSCGTGSVASALAVAQTAGPYMVDVLTPGGQLTVSFEKTEQGFENIWLKGPAQIVFSGKLNPSYLSQRAEQLGQYQLYLKQNFNI